MKIKFGTIKIHFLLRLLLFWLLLFALYRVLFISYYFSKIPTGQSAETFLSFFYALRLDVATACMAITIPYLLWVVQQFYKHKIFHRINFVFTSSLVLVISLLSIANIKIYGEWGTPLSARALNYLLYPKEALASVSFLEIVLLLSSCGALVAGSIFAYRKLINNFSAPIENKKWKLAQIILIPIILAIGYRGGLQLSPVNESSAYYSSVQLNNHIATNNIWYLGHSIVEANDKKNPYNFMDSQTANAITTGLFEHSSDTTSLIKNKTPNIIVIVLESWTADIIKALGSEENITPHFEELCKDGLLFTQMYGSGFRTEQGLVSILSGFPAQPNNSIITTPSKAEQLPSLTVELEKTGYNASFYYGGEVEFANMKSYLLNSHFTKIFDKNNFEKNQLNSKWGAHDEYVLNKQLTELKTEKQPFFSMLLTLSTHEPFEVPMQTPFNGSEEAEKFKKAAYYTDECLFNYFKEAKKQAWYANTLFILVADHGHHLPKNRNMDMPESRRITALITGGALMDVWRGKTFDKIANQNDVAATILSQLQQPYSKFTWSRDIFNPATKEFAYYSNENVVGWIAPQQNVVYSFNSQKVDVQPKSQTILNDTILVDAKAYLQTLYEQYLNY
jgi:phosphoglycerol transferase MdoB-like AlkP superfamily enzyme